MAVQTFLRLVNGFHNVIKTVEQGIYNATAGLSTTRNSLVNTNDFGILDPSLLNAINTSTGQTSAAKIPQLDAAGKLSLTFMPTGVAADTQNMPAFEAL